MTDVRPACRGYDPELWFARDYDTEQLAKAICHTCPLLPACRELALSSLQLYGTWGGLTRRERMQFASGARRTAAKPDVCAASRALAALERCTAAESTRRMAEASHRLTLEDQRISRGSCGVWHYAGRPCTRCEAVRRPLVGVAA